MDNEGEKKSETWEYPESPQADKPPTVRHELTDAVKEVAHPAKRSASRPRVADDLLMLFGRIAGLILLIVIVLTAATVIFRPDADVSSAFTLINTQLSIIIGAVLGYAAHPNEKDD
jgi:hypothetical protein